MFETPTGEIDFDRTNDETIAKLSKAVGTPEARRRLGLDVDGSSSPAPAASTWKDTTAILVDGINLLAMQWAKNAYKLTDEQAVVLVLRRRPDTHEKITTLTTEELDELFPGGIGKGQRLLDIGLLLAGFVAESVQLIAQMKAPASVHPFPTSAPAAAENP